MLSDIFLITGFGLMGPILAIFIKEGITGGSIFAVGLASTIHILVKSAVQLPFSRYVDSHKDKLRWLILGTFAMCSVPFIYMSATSIYHIFIAQVILGISGGLAFPTWLGLWSTNLDKKHESFEWSLYSTLTGLGTAATAAIGAAIAQYFNFRVTFIFTGILSCDSIIALPGGPGTIAELAIAYRYRKPLIFIKGYDNGILNETLNKDRE